MTGISRSGAGFIVWMIPNPMVHEVDRGGDDPNHGRRERNRQFSHTGSSQQTARIRGMDEWGLTNGDRRTPPRFVSFHSSVQIPGRLWERRVGAGGEQPVRRGCCAWGREPYSIHQPPPRFLCVPFQSLRCSGFSSPHRLAMEGALNRTPQRWERRRGVWAAV